MQHTSCTEDRIQHALDSCLAGLRRSPAPQPNTHAAAGSRGTSMSRWSLEELVNRSPENSLILLLQITRKAREVQEHCQYELVIPLAILFSSTLLQTPHCPADSELLDEAMEVFRCFLTWPEPYSGLCRKLLSTLQQELRAPGISYQRLVREEQGLTTAGFQSKTVTVLLMTPGEVPPEFLSVGQQLSDMRHPSRDIYSTLIKHAFQSALGTQCPLASLHNALQAKSVEELGNIFAVVTDVMETAAAMGDRREGCGHVTQGLEGLWERLDIPESSGRKPEETLQTLPLPSPKCFLFPWEKDNFDVLNVLVDDVEYLRIRNGHKEEEEEEQEEDEEDEEEDEECVSGEEDPEETDFEEEPPHLPISCGASQRASTYSTASSLSTSSTFSTLSVASESYAPSLCSVTSGTDSGVEDADDFSSYGVPTTPPSSSPSSEKSPRRSAGKASARLSQHLLQILVRPKKGRILNRAKSLGNPESKNLVIARSQRSNSLPQQVHHLRPEPRLKPQAPALQHVCFRRRPILSSDEETLATTLRVVVFGADHAAGRVARAYSSLQRREGTCPHLSRLFRLQFYFVPVRRGSFTPRPVDLAGCTVQGAGTPTDPQAFGSENSTNDIAHLLGLLDPWYERNTLSLLHLPANLVCKQNSKKESESQDAYERRLPLLADLVLHYCREATNPTLIQLYQAELTLAGGERRTEVFIHSLELGHTAGTRAVQAMGSAKKRFGIDGDREAVPLNLEVLYNKVVVSGRSQWKREAKVCTSLNLTKACKTPEELDPKMECLLLSMTEVLKRQNRKAKKSYNQHLSTWEVKVDKVQVSGGENTTFAVCLDQDERKILQSVVRCEVSVCSKPDSSADWRQARVLSPQIRPLHPTFCSLLCLPVHTFVGALP